MSRTNVLAIILSVLSFMTSLVANCQNQNVNKEKFLESNTIFKDYDFFTNQGIHITKKTNEDYVQFVNSKSNNNEDLLLIKYYGKSRNFELKKINSANYGFYYTSQNEFQSIINSTSIDTILVNPLNKSELLIFKKVDSAKLIYSILRKATDRLVIKEFCYFPLKDDKSFYNQLCLNKWNELEENKKMQGLVYEVHYSVTSENMKFEDRIIIDADNIQYLLYVFCSGDAEKIRYTRFNEFERSLLRCRQLSFMITRIITNVIRF